MISFKKLFEDSGIKIAPYDFSSIRKGDIVTVNFLSDKGNGYLLTVYKDNKFIANLPFDNSREAREEGWDI